MLREFERAELLKYRSFAAFGAYARRADFPDLRFLDFADAENFRTRGKSVVALQLISPKRPLNPPRGTGSKTFLLLVVPDNNKEGL